MNRQNFANTKSKLRKGYWQRETNDVLQCSKCNGGFAFEPCNVCHGTGQVIRERFSYRLYSGVLARAQERVEWGACGNCGCVTREYRRTGRCSCSSQKCLSCKGKGCRACNFKGKS